MNIPATIPLGKRQMLEQLVASLSQVPHVVAIVLGGSYASGTQHSASDVDVGLYYRETAPFDLAVIKSIAYSISRPGSPPTVTGFYEWGAWVNGGAWIKTRTGKIDILYRNLDHVQRTIAEAQQGIVQHDYDQQPTTGFYSIAYLAETHICIPLYDPGAELARLKQHVATYPPKLKHAVTMNSLWGAEFTFLAAREYAAAGDVYNTAGCLMRAAACLTQALFALNSRYFISEKRVMQTLATFSVLPPGYVQQIERILACPGQTSADLCASVAQLESVWRDVAALAGGAYRPQFVLPEE